MGRRKPSIIGVISDTHGLVRPEALAALAGSALILHAGDVGSPEVLLALRAILLNLHFAVCSGEPVTVDMMRRLIDRADQDKIQHAHERLASGVARRTS